LQVSPIRSKGSAEAKPHRRSNSLAKLRPIATESPQTQMHNLRMNFVDCHNCKIKD